MTATKNSRVGGRGEAWPPLPSTPGVTGPVSVGTLLIVDILIYFFYLFFCYFYFSFYFWYILNKNKHYRFICITIVTDLICCAEWIKKYAFIIWETKFSILDYFDILTCLNLLDVFWKGLEYNCLFFHWIPPSCSYGQWVV